LPFGRRFKNRWANIDKTRFIFFLQQKKPHAILRQQKTRIASQPMQELNDVHHV
jgi:hypothetical protein